MSKSEQTENRLCMEVAALRHLLGVAVDALREIADADPLHIGLDPNWAQRIAEAALEGILWRP